MNNVVYEIDMDTIICISLFQCFLGATICCMFPWNRVQPKSGARMNGEGENQMNVLLARTFLHCIITACKPHNSEREKVVHLGEYFFVLPKHFQARNEQSG